jgi:hypothetical protein
MGQLEDRIRKMESQPRAGSTSIDQGRLVVTDASGVQTIQIGLLDDGSYDIGIIDPSTGKLVRLGQLAFGQRGVFDTGSCSTNSPTYGNPNISGSAGPTLTNVLIGDSGRAKISLFMGINYQESSPTIQAAGGASVSITGATTIAASNDHSAGDYLSITPSPTFWQRDTRVGATWLQESLNPGLHTFTVLYKSPFSNTVNFEDRSLFVEPF